MNLSNVCERAFLMRLTHGPWPSESQKVIKQVLHSSLQDCTTNAYFQNF